MNYSLNPKDVKQVIDAVLKGLPFDKKQFMYYHLNRNYFNVKNNIKYLTHFRDNTYYDNFGQAWELQSNFKNFFHTPKFDWVGSMLGTNKPYSRKFLLDDTVTGVNGEFEMIIRHDGKRIDALTNETYQETYNFSRTRYASNHKKLDVDPHNENSSYTFRQDMGYVTVNEKK